MKKFIILVITILLSSNDINAQYIFSLSVVPSNPKTNDTLTIIASCVFPSAGCDEHTQYHFVNGNSISAGALHCLGFMTVICNHTDTFTISPLTAGNYTFYFQLDAGYLPAPCTPGIVPGPEDSISFTVTTPNGLNEATEINNFLISPNPVSNELLLNFETITDPISIMIYSVTGQTILCKTGLTSSDLSNKFDVSTFPQGVYFITLTSLKSSRTGRFVKM